MRNKIIAVNAVIVLIVGLLSYLLVRHAVANASGNMEQLTADAKHIAQGATARIQLDGLRAERWLVAKANEPGMSDPLAKASPSARGDAATVAANQILAAAKGSPAFEGRIPSTVYLVDATGRVVGRSETNLSRGDDLGATYKPLREAITSGQSGSDIWANKTRNELVLASYAPLRDETGKSNGAIVIGTSLNDVLSRASDLTAGRGLALVVPAGDKWDVVAQSTHVSPRVVEGVTSRPGDTVKPALETGTAVATVAGDSVIGAAPLEGFGDGRRGAIVVDAPSSRINDPGSIASAIPGITALGVLLVVIGGWLLGNYIDRPINMLEEGLLAILNGQADKRFELDHPELGGLAFRIDQLLNQLMGVEEDTTDEEGRPSKAPTAADYHDAMAVDGSRAAAAAEGGDAGVDAATLQRLASEAGDAYYRRIYAEYIDAKRALGEDTSHISHETFVGRIQGMESEAAQKYGKTVRYQVKASSKEVVLIAVPLS